MTNVPKSINKSVESPTVLPKFRPPKGAFAGFSGSFAYEISMKSRRIRASTDSGLESLLPTTSERAGASAGPGV